MPHLPAGATSIELTLDHPVAARVQLPEFEAGDPLPTVTLPRGHLLTAHVSGLPPDTPVCLQIQAVENGAYTATETLTLVDDTLQFVMTDDPMYLVRLEADGYAIRPQLWYDYRSDNETPVRFTEPTTIDFVAQPLHTVTGRLVDGVTGEPVVGVTVEATSLDPDAVPKPGSTAPLDRAVSWRPSTGFDQTDASGSFVMRLPPGTTELSTRTFAPDRKTGYEPRPPRQVLTVDGPLSLDDWLHQPIPPLTGRVLRPDGSPAAGVIVRPIGGRETGYLTQEDPVQTGPDGRFEIRLSNMPMNRLASPGDRIESAETFELSAFDPASGEAATLEVSGRNSDAWNDLTLPLVVDQPWAPLEAELRSRAKQPVRTSVAEHTPRPDLVLSPAPPLTGHHWWNVPDGGSSLDWSQLRGQWVLLDFYFTDCGPCRVTTPRLIELQTRYGGSDPSDITLDAQRPRFTVLGVHRRTGSIDDATAYIEKAGINYPVVFDDDDESIVTAFEPYGLRGYPTMMLVDPDGRVALSYATATGPTLHHFMREIIRGLVLTEATELPPTIWSRPVRE